MGALDDTTWQALGLTLTLLGLGVSFLVWRRRGAAAGGRGVAWSLLPLAAALTGTLRLLWRIGDAFVDWAVRLVFSPLMWLGIVLAGLSLTLFVVSGVLRRRAALRSGTGGGSGSTAGPRRGRKQLPPTPVQGRPAVAGDDDMADIEALLKKHGIT